MRSPRRRASVVVDRAYGGLDVRGARLRPRPPRRARHGDGTRAGRGRTPRPRPRAHGERALVFVHVGGDPSASPAFSALPAPGRGGRDPDRPRSVDAMRSRDAQPLQTGKPSAPRAAVRLGLDDQGRLPSRCSCARLGFRRYRGRGQRRPSTCRGSPTKPRRTPCAGQMADAMGGFLRTYPTHWFDSAGLSSESHADPAATFARSWHRSSSYLRSTPRVLFTVSTSRALLPVEAGSARAQSRVSAIDGASGGPSRGPS